MTHCKDSKDGKGAAKIKVPKSSSPCWKPNLFSCFAYMKKCRKPSCDYWHPPDCVHRQDGRRLQSSVKSVRFFIQTTVKRYTKSQTRIRHQRKRPLQVLRHAVIKNWVCVSQDFDLPKPKVVLTREIRPILKNNVGIPPIVHLELQYATTAERFIKIREHLGPSLGVIQGGQKHHRNARERRSKQHAMGKRRCKKSRLALGQIIA